MQSVIQQIYDTFDEAGRADPMREPFADFEAMKHLESVALKGDDRAQVMMAALLRGGIEMPTQEQAVRMAISLKANGLDCTAENTKGAGPQYRIIFEPAAARFEAMAYGNERMVSSGPSQEQPVNPAEAPAFRQPGNRVPAPRTVWADLSTANAQGKAI